MVAFRSNKLHTISLSDLSAEVREGANKVDDGLKLFEFPLKLDAEGRKKEREGNWHEFEKIAATNSCDNLLRN